MRPHRTLQRALQIIALGLALSACAKQDDAPAMPSSAPSRDASFAVVLAGLDLEDPAYQLAYKSSGTSLGLKITRDGKKIGKWLPKNEGADPEAQVVSYYLGAYLGMPELVIPAGYHTVKGRALAEFHRMLLGAQERIPLRARNQQALLKALERNPHSMEGIFTQPGESFELAELIDTNGYHGLGTLRQDQQIARLLHAENPMPSRERELDLGSRKRINGRKPVNDELTLARELSKIMVMDVLCGQFDRFSGGNLEGTVGEDGKLHFIARDNGGAGLVPGSGKPEQYFELVSRFDSAQIRLVRALALELAQDSADVAARLRIRSNPETFISRVNQLLAFVDRQLRRHGEERVFFPE